jgi:gluconolactonase
LLEAVDDSAVVAPDRTRLGVLRMPELPANMEWGDDGRTLYMTARTSLHRVRATTGR